MPADHSPVCSAGEPQSRLDIGRTHCTNCLTGEGRRVCANRKKKISTKQKGLPNLQPKEMTWDEGEMGGNSKTSQAKLKNRLARDHSS